MPDYKCEKKDCNGVLSWCEIVQRFICLKCGAEYWHICISHGKNKLRSVQHMLHEMSNVT